MSDQTPLIAVILVSIVLMSTPPTAGVEFGSATAGNDTMAAGNTPTSEVNATQIDSCARITDPGTYALTQNITNATEDTCIRIETSDVIFDGNGYTIDGTTDPTANDFSNLTVAVKIANSSTALSNITVRNVTATEWSDGVSAGPTLASPDSTSVDNVRIETVTVRRADAGGIVFANATDITIGNNSLQQTGVGIALFNTSSATLVENAVNWTFWAFWVNRSSETTLRNNYALNAKRGFFVESSRGIHAVNNTANRTYQGIRVEQAVGYTDLRNNSILGSDSVPRHGNSSTGITIINATLTAGVSPSFHVRNNDLTGTFTGLGGVINIVEIAADRNRTLQSLEITDNRINHQSSVDSPTRGISLYARGNESEGSYSTIRHVTIHNNSIVGAPSSGIGVGGPEAAAATLRNITISSNTITRSQAGIVALSSQSQSTTSHLNILSNQIVQTNHDGIRVSSNGLARTSHVDISNNHLTQVKAGIAVAANHNATTEQISARQNTVMESQFGLFVHARDSARVASVITDNGTFRNATDDGILLLRDPNASARDLVISAATIANVKEAGISAWNSAFDFTVRDTVITNSSEGVLAGRTRGNWTIHNTTITESGVGVNAERSTGAWTIRGTRIVNSTREGVFADYASGDWIISNSIIRNSTYENIDVDPSSGNWTIANTVLSGSNTGVFAEDSTGRWTITNSSIINSTEGVVAANTTAAWTIHNTSFAQHADDAVDADFAAGNWTISGSRMVNNGEGVAAVNTTGAWTITNSSITNSTEGVVAANTTAAWTIHDTVLAQHSNEGVGTDYATGNWTISGSRIVDNENGVAAVNTTGMWTITNTTFSGNDEAGINAPGAVPAGNASYNYWGATGGPGGDFDGLGDAVYGNVSISPFYTDEALTDLATQPTQPAPFDIETQIPAQALVQGDPLSTTVTVRNTGNQKLTKSVGLIVDTDDDGEGRDETPRNTTTVTLAAGENTSVTLSTSTTTLPTISTSYGVYAVERSGDADDIDDNTVANLTVTARNQTLVVSKANPAAYQSIQHAVDNATTGATIVVYSDVYNESVHISKSVTLVSSAAHNTDEFDEAGAPADAAVLDSDGTRSNAFVIETNATGVRIEGFKIREYTGSGIYAGEDGSADVTVRHNTIKRVTEGVTAWSRYRHHVNWTVTANVISNASLIGIGFVNADGAKIRGNIVRRSPEATGDPQFSGGVTLVANNATADAVTIQHNRITGTYRNSNRSGGIVVRAGWPPSNSTGQVSNLTIANNTVRNASTELAGIDISTYARSEITATTVRNNTIAKNDRGFAVSTAGPRNGTYIDLVVVDNSITENSQQGIRIDDGVAADAVAVHRNRISDNGEAGLLYDGTANLNASFNYWGEPGGPGGEFDGLGNAVYGNVTVRPYYTDTELVTLSSTVRPTLTVNNSDPDKYNSIQAAVGDAPPETTIIVHSGVYNESIQIDQSVAIVSEAVYRSDSQTNRGAPANAPVLDSNGTSYAAFNIRHGTSGVRVEGLAIRNYTHGIRAWNNGTTSVTVKQNTIQEVANGVLVGGDPTNNEIRTGQHRRWDIAFNEIRNATTAGMQIDNLVNATIRSNRIYRSADASGGSNFSVGISTVANNETVTDVTLQNNTVAGTYENFGIGVRAGHPVYNASGTLTDVTIVDNRVKGTLPGDGISISAGNGSYTTNVSVKNNTITDATTDWPGIGVFAVDTGQIGSVTVQNNTVVANEYGFGIGIAAQGSYETIQVLGNTLSQNEQDGVIIGNGTAGDGLTVHENRIKDNAGAGLLHNGTGEVNATRNWWGTADGPSGAFTGSGDEVFGTVAVRPFYTDANLTTLSPTQDDGDSGGSDGDGGGGGDTTATATKTTTAETDTSTVTQTGTSTEPDQTTTSTGDGGFFPGTSETTTASPTGTTGQTGPGFTIMGTILALLGAALLLRRTQ